MAMITSRQTKLMCGHDHKQIISHMPPAKEQSRSNGADCQRTGTAQAARAWQNVEAAVEVRLSPNSLIKRKIRDWTVVLLGH